MSFRFHAVRDENSVSGRRSYGGRRNRETANYNLQKGLQQEVSKHRGIFMLHLNKLEQNIAQNGVLVNNLLPPVYRRKYFHFSNSIFHHHITILFSGNFILISTILVAHWRL